MKVSDIKVQALTLMYPDEIPAYMTGGTVENYSKILGDFSEMLGRMTGSIARCLDVIVERRVLPVKRLELYLADAETIGKMYKFDLSASLDFFDVDRVIMQAENAYNGYYPYRMEGKTLVLLSPDEAASFSLLYHPTVTPPSVWANEAELTGVPDELSRLIPYFIKGELFREDEPGEAAEAMAWFEQRLSEISNKSTGMQTNVATVYAQGWL